VALPASEIDRVEAPARSHNATHVMIFRTAALLATVFGVASMLSAAPRTSPNYSIPAEAIDSGGRKNGSPTYQNQGSAGLISGASRNASGTVAVGSGYAPQAAAGGSPLQVLNALSRKVHGATSFDIPLPLTGLAGVECRNAGAGGSYQVLVTFTTPVTVGGTSIMSRDGLATATHSVSGAVVTLNLSAVANAQTLGITLLNVSNGSTTNNINIPMAVLIGDTNGDGTVNAGDALQTRSRSGQPASTTNFRSDVNLDGVVNSGDSLSVRSRSGSFLP
jgi:hypothetical protein